MDLVRSVSYKYANDDLTMLIDFTASADRRPVDPPPVVELRLFEGEGSNKNDITFSHNANFFCFATLLDARPIAHGRVQNSPQQTPPVLSGMAVSSMAYLDRPAEAGYFIFPDLSVRHEGRYKLKFSLWEQTKESKDETADVAPAANEDPQQFAAGAFECRIEANSAPFQVYSAKKFPGLAESTVLSRTVAEQGCRVRIRRDVRMRRREGKGGDYDSYEENFSRARSATPADPRQRSVSNTSVDIAAYDRRPSAYADSANRQTYPSQYATPTPATPQCGAFLGFGSRSASRPQFQTPHFAQPAPPQPQYQSQYHPAPASHLRPQQPHATYPYDSRPEFQPYTATALREEYVQDYRRPSASLSRPEPESSRPSVSYPPYPVRAEQPILAPITVNPAPPPEPRYETSPATLARARTSNGLPSPSYQERPSYGSFSGPAGPEARAGTKRSFDSVFSAPSLTQPLHNGARPLSSHGKSSPTFQDSEDVGIDAFTMQYRRADGSASNRELPSLS